MPLHLAFRHPWNLSPREAADLQRELRGRVETRDRLDPVERVAGVDVGFEDGGRTVRAAVAVLSFPALAVVETAVARLPTTFPYVPGLLSFRELPGVLAALERLARLPDLILYDGQGTAHPRRFGIACHLGVMTDIPTIGVAKTRLTGEHKVLRPERGAWVPLTDGGETIGAVLRTRGAVAPVYVSVGHRVSLETAIRWVLACAPRFRLPETTRRAHTLASVAPP